MREKMETKHSRNACVVCVCVCGGGTPNHTEQKERTILKRTRVM